MCSCSFYSKLTPAKYSACSVSLLHQVWYDYARWHADAGSGVAQATACLVRAVAALPNCLLLHFALADLQEAQGQTEAAREVGLCSVWSNQRCALKDQHCDLPSPKLARTALRRKALFQPEVQHEK
jgi:hypothetical protein